MQEKLDELYKDYYKKRLDLIFSDQKRPDIPVIVYKGKYNLESADGKCICEEPYDSMENYSDGYFLVTKGEKYNFIDKNGKLINNVWYDLAHSFKDGYALVALSEKGYKKYNFIDTKGRLLNKEWYSGALDFSCGYALVRIDDKYNYVDGNGKLISKQSFDEGMSFKDNYAHIRMGKKWNLIDTTGKIMFSEWYDNIGDFKDGYAWVRNGSKENYIDINGKLLCDTWYDHVLEFKDGKSITIKDECVRIIDTKGNILFEEQYDRAYFDSVRSLGIVVHVRKKFKENILTINGLLFDQWPKYLSTEYVTSDKFNLYGVSYNGRTEHPVFVCNEKDLGEYTVKKTVSGYQCSIDNDKFKIKYEPFKSFGKRYILCFDNKNLSIKLFDRFNNSYMEIGNVKNIDFDDHFIHDYKNKKHYLIYNEEIYDVTDYYSSYLASRKNIQVNPDVEIITKEDFFYKYEEWIKKATDDLIKGKSQSEEKKDTDNLQKIKEQEKQEREAMLKKQKEALFQIQKSLSVLDEIEKKTGTKQRIQVSNLFVDVDDHKEINPMYLEVGLLKFIDLSMISFKNVKISGIDFRGCNIHLRPQEVYGKDLSGCNFEGLHIGPFMDFTGVDIRGCRFSKDNDPTTIDQGSATFSSSIYDETTTFDGIPFTEIYKGVKTSHIK